MTSEEQQPSGAAAASRPPRGLVLAVAAVLAVLVGVVATVLLWPEKRTAAAPPPPSPTASSPAPAPSPTPTPTRVVPYPHFGPGECFDHPQLSKVITKPEPRPCDGPHDGEAIAAPLLPDGLTTEAQIGRAMRDGCKDAVAAAQGRQDGGTWYGFPVGPAMTAYREGWRDFSCTVTSSNRQGGAKLTAPIR
ncbi:hypothetical protein ACWGB8_04955 [Kitasatospora sp. NPDC054939]